MARVLWLSVETPDRNGQGGQRRQFHQIRELAALGHDLTVLTPAGPQDHSTLHGIARVERHRIAILGRALRFLVMRIRKRVATGGWDAIIVSHDDSLFLLPETQSTAPVLVDLHNVMSSWHRRRGLDDLAADFHLREVDALSRADAVSTCSAEESRRLLAAHPELSIPAIVAPLGVDPEEWPEQDWNREEPLVALFGSWGWHPNGAGLDWFRDDVWPSVRSRVPTARALVAGSGVNDSEAWPAGLEYVGRVPSVAEFTASATVVAVPVFDGVGAAVKFAESLASGAAVIATPDGANAFDDAKSKVSSDAGEWADWIVERLTDRANATVPDPARDDALSRLSWHASVGPLDEWIRAQKQRRDPA